jgi:hypothetical protein
MVPTHCGVGRRKAYMVMKTPSISANPAMGIQRYSMRKLLRRIQGKRRYADSQAQQGPKVRQLETGEQI